MRLFLDANVLFTAAHSRWGKAALVVELAEDGLWEVTTSDLAVEEARRNLERKFPECRDRLTALLLGIQRVPPLATEDLEEGPLPLPPKDQHIFAAALRSKATHLLTGDQKHFGRYMNDAEKSGGVIIQTVGDFLVASSR